MRYLLVNQFFWPESTGTGRLLTDVARTLVERGHEVQVIAGNGSYGEPNREPKPPVDLHLIRTSRFVRGKLGRVLSYASFYVGAVWKAMTLPRPDVVLTLTTPPLISILGTLLKFTRQTQHVIWNMDLYPEILVDLNQLRSGSVVERAIGALATFSYRHADSMIALGSCMEERLIARGAAPESITIVHNWVGSDSITPLPHQGDPGKLVLLYSGNLGLAHEVPTLQTAMVELRDDPRFEFLFVGGGARRASLTKFVKDEHLASTNFHPYVPADRLSEGLAAGDIGVVTQIASCWGSVVPSKVYALMAAERPILFIGPARATPTEIIRTFGCGWQIEPGDAAGLVSLLRRLAVNRDEIATAGRAARRALIENYDLPLGIERIVRLLGA